MGKHVFKKLEPSHIQGICVICGKNPQRKKAGQEKYMAMCRTCNTKRYQTKAGKAKALARIDARNRPYRIELKEKCERCNFIPAHVCQLDVDHIDGNHKNNDPTNLQTLCANCHRLKSWQERQSSPA